jgi:acetyltransferase-like isoleucine patch superfamily enzyme
MRVFGKAALEMYRMLTRVRNKVFSIAIGGAFAHYGKNSVVSLPLRISGEDRIWIGSGVFLGSGCWLQTSRESGGRAVAIRIGDNASIVGGMVISAVQSVIIEDAVLIARNAYISDHAHSYQDLSKPILAQGVDRVAPVVIKRGAWLGENVVVCPGVTIGRGSVVGANSVVKSDVPDFSIAVGSPARVVKCFGQPEPSRGE